MGKRGPQPWQPPETVTIVDEMGIQQPPTPWYQFLGEQLRAGKSRSKIAKTLGISHLTLIKHIENDDISKKIATDIQKDLPHILLERAVELAMDEHKPNTTLLIYLLKTVGGLGDGALKTEDPKALNLLHPGMTKSEALKKIKEIQAKRDAAEKKKAEVEKNVSEAY